MADRSLMDGGTMLILLVVWATGLCVGMGLVLALMKYASSLPADEVQLEQPGPH